MRKILLALLLVMASCSFAFGEGMITIGKKKAAGGAMPQETVRPAADVSFTAHDSLYQFKNTGSTACEVGVTTCYTTIDEETLDSGDYVKFYDGAAASDEEAVFRLANATGTGTISTIRIYFNRNSNNADTFNAQISGNAGSSYESAQIVSTGSGETYISFSVSWTQSNVTGNNFYVKLINTQQGKWDNTIIYQLWAVINP